MLNKKKIETFIGKPCKWGHSGERYATGTKGCVICARIRAETRKKEKPEEIKKWRDANKERLTKNRNDWFKNNKEKKAASDKKYKDKNKQKYSEYLKIWRKENIDKVRQEKRASEAKRRAKKKNVKGAYKPDDIKFLYKTQCGKCALCKIDLKNNYHIDHIIPLSRGGENTKRNIQILCKPCNMRKSAKDPIVFAQEIGLLL